MNALLPGDDVDQFRIRRPLGQGGMGQVYLARDLLLGRLVALKLIRPEQLGQRTVTRFMDEARITAQFNHPHIVTIHAVGTHEGSPYIALEYLDGESLADRLGKERFSVDEIIRIGRAIADALAHAHRQNILHCDLKPENIVFGSDGRLRVVDFGLASGAGKQELSLGGTPNYMAPEQNKGEALTDRVDIWALGVILFECFEGTLPKHSAEPQRAGIPPEISRLVAKTLSADPLARPTALELRAAFDAVLSPFHALGVNDSPFRGLLPFQEKHAAVFFGREPEITELLERMRTEVILPIIGPSGVGKSSLVHAGLIPRLRAQGGWTIISFRPGSSPLRALAQKLTTAEDKNFDELAAKIRATPSLATLRLASMSVRPEDRVLLVVDQLEELFTHATDISEVSDFLNAVMSAADLAVEPLRVLLTVRDDFVARLPKVKSLFVLRALDREALRRTITEPLRYTGYAFDAENTVDDILAELHGEAGELPLLQFMLQALWEARDQKKQLLLRATYDQFGGVAGALADRADTLLSAFDPAEIQAAKTILLRLVSKEGTKRLSEPSRLIAGFGAVGERALTRLIDARLLTQRRAVEEENPTVELAHESLITRWARLALWLEEAREERVLAAEIEEAARLWDRRGRQEEETWVGRALEAVQHRVAMLKLALEPLSAEFLEAGAQRERRRARWRKIAASAAAIVLIATTGGALFLANLFREREQETKKQRDELARAVENLGESIVWLEPFDWDAEKLSSQPVKISELPSLSLSVHRVVTGRPIFEPGATLERNELRVEVLTSSIATRGIFRVEAPGMSAFLRIDARGRAGEICSPSWVRVQQLPGYAERKSGVTSTLRIGFPTCRATSSGLLEIPGGNFVYGGFGEPPMDKLEEAEPEKTIELPKFLIDRTELPNAAFSLYEPIARISGDELPSYPAASIRPVGARPEHPVTGVNVRTAHAYCLFFGKRLPLVKEWVKAVRGGLLLPDGKTNPVPRRLFPWIGATVPAGVNFQSPGDGCEKTCPTLRPEAHRSIYGATDLVGNVWEWGLGWEAAHDDKLYPILGGSYDEPSTNAWVNSANSNMRDTSQRDYKTGFRCVY